MSFANTIDNIDKFAVCFIVDYVLYIFKFNIFKFKYIIAVIHKWVFLASYGHSQHYLGEMIYNIQQQNYYYHY